jgi:hypothetical protein
MFQNNYPEGWSDELANLAQDISNGSCVLLIGPDVLTIEGESLQVNMRRYLYSNYRQHISLYYEREQFFLFERNGKPKALRGVKTYFRNLRTDFSVYRKIAAIPFHLVVSINPDNYLLDIMRASGVNTAFQYFEHKGVGNAPVAEPTADNPLLYNLCGSIDKDESLILDYDDLWQFMKRTLNPEGLPDNLLTTLKNANSFLFLGFSFDKWYSQLLLRLLSDVHRTNFVLKTTHLDHDVTDFLVRQFNVEFPTVEGNHDFFDALYEKCAADNMLRKPTETAAQQRLLNLLKTNKPLDFFAQAADATADTEGKNELLLQESRYHHNEAEKRKNTITEENHRVESTKILWAGIDWVYRYVV